MTLSPLQNQPPRQCGDCTECCYVAQVNEKKLSKPSCQICPFLNKGCSLYNKPERPKICFDFQCAWLHGVGNNNDRPDNSGVLVSLNEGNGGTWIFIMDLKKNAHLTTGKHICLEMINRFNFPAIITDYDNLKTGKGDYVLIKQPLENRSKQIRGKFLAYYAKDINKYQLIIT